MNDITVYIADDHAILRDGLKKILHDYPHYTIIGESGDGKTAIEEIEQMKPRVVILDISLPLMSGIEVARQIKKYHAGIKIVILTRHDSIDYVNQLMKYGVDAYILKQSASEDLVKAIDEVIAGNMYISPRILKDFMNDISRNRPAEYGNGNQALGTALSDREKQVTKLIAEGKTSDEIAQLLRISSHTVKVHRYNIMQKLKADNSTEIVKYALRTGLIDL